MGTVGVEPTYCEMTKLVIFAVVLISVGLTNAAFFSPRSTCTSNNQCPNIRRQSTNCGGSLKVLGLRIPTKCRNSYNNIGGRCVSRTKLLCRLGGGSNCNYRVCAECLESRDCPPCYTCSGYTCSYTCGNDQYDQYGRPKDDN